MYTDQERRIYGPIHDGQAQVYIDPIRAYRRLTQSLQGEPDVWIRRFNEPEHPQHHEAVENVLRAAVWALELVPFDKQSGQGLAEEQVKERLRGFLEFVEGNVQPGPNLRPCAELTPASSTADLTSRPTFRSG